MLGRRRVKSKLLPLGSSLYATVRSIGETLQGGGGLRRNNKKLPSSNIAANIAENHGARRSLGPG
jgi:hypothetical protein